MVLRGSLFFLIALAAALSAKLTVPPALAGNAAGSPEANTSEVEAAFNSSKELGTAEAWNAFLANYPTGFHSDLARAYLKKLTGAPGAAPAAAAASTATVQELPCARRTTLNSVNTDVPTKITFVNTSGMYRSLQWIGYKGEVKDWGGLNAGAQITLDTYVTHPWMVSTGPGDCLQIFMPTAAPATVELVRLAADDRPQAEPLAQRSQVRPDTKQKQPEYKPVKQVEKKPLKQAPKKPPLVCGTNYKLSKGQCVLVQNCGSNAYRSPEGDCYCNKNYMMKNGKCIWKQDKQGFEVKPWEKSGCKSWQAQCSKGNGKACGKYEENCQVN